MRVLPDSHADELDIEVESPKALLELKGGNFSRFYGILDEYRELKGQKTGIVKKIVNRITGKKKQNEEEAPDFKKINLVFDEGALDDLETHCELDTLREKFKGYCATERKREEKTAERLEFVKDCLMFGGTIAVTYGLGFAAYFGYLAVLKETPLLISAAADVVLAGGLGVRHKEMAHRDKIDKIEMVDDAELNFVTHDEYKALLSGRKNKPAHLLHEGCKENKTPAVTRTIEVDCCTFFEDEEKDGFSVDGLIEMYRKLHPEKSERMRKRLSVYINEKVLGKKNAGPKAPEAGEESLRIAVYAKEGCRRAADLQEKFRTYCRSERMKAEKTADTVERIKDMVIFAGPVATTYGLSLAVYGGLIEVAKHMPLFIDTAADGVLASGLFPRKVELGYREKVKLLEKLENAEIEVRCPSSACSRKGFYCRKNAR